MKYLIIQTGDGYWEYPVTEEDRSFEERIRKLPGVERVFCLGKERHLYIREEDVTISSGKEAVLWISGLQSRFYIRGMQMFSDISAKELLYLNQQRLMPGEFTLYPGDVLLFNDIKLEIWEKKLAVWGHAGEYITALPEQAPVQEPDNFPFYKRSPRLIKKPSAEKISLELPGEKEKQDKKGLLMSILPPLGMAALTTVVGLLTGRGIYLLMSAMTAGMTAVFSGIRYADEIKEIKERNRKRIESYVAYMWQKQRKIAMVHDREQEVYAYQYPDTDGLIRMVREYDSRIYERLFSDHDFLTVSIGHYTGTPAFKLDGKEPAWNAKDDWMTEMARDIRRRYSVIDKPKVVDLKEAHLGIVGPKEIIHRQLKILMAQTVFFQSYHDLRIIAVYDKEHETEFAWMRWLPHMRIHTVNVLGMVSSERIRDLVFGSMSQILKERAERKKGEKKDVTYLPHYLFVIDEPFWIMDQAIMEYLRMDGSMLGFSMIYTSPALSNLPEYIGSVLLLDHSKEGTLLLEARKYAKQKIRLYSAQGSAFEWLARDLSILKHEQGITSYVPKSVTFFELYGIRKPEELAIKNRWRNNQSHQSLAVPVGMRSANDILFLNLHEKAHGPHGLVAGTTGSGKSELIQTYILSLAVNFHPNEVGFLLIDYKGGGMANLFRELPHHLGTITNLDGAGSMRALICVKAELARRQRVFGEYQVNHINGYMRLFKEGKALEPIPHLFIISDEFAELKKEQPDFMKELVSAARIGRSLGVHLILATQKPAGVVDEQIWSNSRFRICLKVQNESDSKEILKTPDAAGITLPGRAYLQAGNNEIYELFQSAFSKTAYREEHEEENEDDERIYMVNELGQGELINQDLSGRTGEYRVCRTQLEAVVEHIREIFTEEKPKEQVKKPWLPPLKGMLLSPYITRDNKIASDVIRHKKLSICMGKTDIPKQQEQKEWKHSFEEEGNLLFVASAGSGKTVFLTTLLMSLAISSSVDEINFYILDYGNNGCMPLKELPHTAEYIPLEDEERYRKFKKLMTEEISARKRMLAKYAAPSLEAYQELSGHSVKAVVVAIDQFDGVKEAGIEEEEFFTRLTRDGVSLGIYTAATASRVNAIRHATLNNFKKKIAGYAFDENEILQTVGRTAHKLPDVKGRVLISGEHVLEAQIYMMASCEDKAGYGRALKLLIQEIQRRSQGTEAPHIPVLPQEFYSDMFKEYTEDKSSYLVGLDTEEVTGRGFDRTAGLFVIIGNTGTGKTNMLRVLADQAALRGRTYIFDSKSMEMYDYQKKENVLYIGNKKDTEMFMQEVAEELERRRQFLKKRLGECQGIHPKKLTGETPFCTILIDDLEDFTESVKMDLDKITALIKEGTLLGITCIITVHAAKSRGVNTMDRMVRQAANGLVLSSQGVMPIFPVSSMRELPKFGDGLLFRNGIFQRVRLPRHLLPDEVRPPVRT